MVGDGPGGMVGNLLTVPNNGDGTNWGAVRLLDYSLAQTAYALADSRLWLPGQPAALELKTAPLGVVGRLGMYHLDITGPPPRGPFTKTAPSPTATYPALWNHNAATETRLVCIPDSQLIVRQGMEAKAAEVWATASRAHVNLDFTFGSQPLAVAFTERKSIGGRIWPNVIFDDERFDAAFAVWSNCTLGLLSYWWHANRQQSSKAGMTIRSAETLPVLDFRALSDAQLQHRASHLRRIPGIGPEARLPRGRRRQPRLAGPTRRMRPAGIRLGYLRRRAPSRRQMVRRAVGAWGEEAACGR